MTLHILSSGVPCAQLLRKLGHDSGNLEVELEGYSSLVAHAAIHSESILRLLLEEFHCDPNLRTTGEPACTTGTSQQDADMSDASAAANGELPPSACVALGCRCPSDAALKQYRVL